jgi:hypothetical protein
MVNATIWQADEPLEPARPCGKPRPERKGQIRQDAMGRLLQTIEGEIIPRLVLALQSAPALAEVSEPSTGPEEVTEFARLVATHEVSVASAYVSALLNQGVALERVYLQLLAPAARLLGEWWKQDVRDFTEVTSGLCRMHQLLHEFSPRFLHDAQPTAPDRCVLLVPMPGDQHSFGRAGMSGTCTPRP